MMMEQYLPPRLMVRNEMLHVKQFSRYPALGIRAAVVIVNKHIEQAFRLGKQVKLGQRFLTLCGGLFNPHNASVK